MKIGTTGQKKRLFLLHLFGKIPILVGRWSILRKVVKVLFLLIITESVVFGNMDKLRALTITQSCDRLHSEVIHMMQVNELINKEDPQAYLIMQRTLNLYLSMIEQQCPANKNKKMEIVAK